MESNYGGHKDFGRSLYEAAEGSCVSRCKAHCKHDAYEKAMKKCNQEVDVSSFWISGQSLDDKSEVKNSCDPPHRTSNNVS